MGETIATTPFGGGRFGVSDFRLREWIEERRKALGDNDTGKADKWELLKALTEARAAFGLGNGTIHVLEVLLGFHQSKEIDGATPIVVFPSNREICRRTRGMTDRTVRRHLRSLVDAALLVRRDSPNGKRYCLRDGAGQVEEAFGFDLAPLALKASAIYEAADRAREQLRRLRKVRGEITLRLRDVSRIVTLARDEGRSGPWAEFEARLADLSGTVGRFTPLREHQDRLDALEELLRDVENAYLDSLSEQEMSANDGQDVRHIQNSNPELYFEPSCERDEEANAKALQTVPEGVQGRNENEPNGCSEKAPPMSLGLFKLACTEFVALAPGDLRTWRDVLAAGDLMRTMLGISPHAMHAAEKAMGPLEAAVVVACILQRHESIQSPGGYLRALTARKLDGRFSVRPMVDALVPK